MGRTAALASFILACARARPDKSLDTLDAEFVLEKIKDPAFARSVSRERIFDSAAELGVELKEHIEADKIFKLLSVIINK